MQSMRCALLLVLLLVACAQQPLMEQETRAANITIVAFGDSLTEGLGVPKDQAYPAQLERALQERGYSVQVINAGVSGETSAGALSRVDWILQLQPDIIILETGANDGLRALPVTYTSENIDAIITRMQQANTTVVLAGMIMTENLGATYTEAFAAMYPAKAQQHNVSFIPFFLADVAGVSELNTDDEIHPNAQGYSIIVERNVLPVLVPVLDQVRERK